MTKEEAKNICITRWENQILIQILIDIQMRINSLAMSDDLHKLKESGHWDMLAKVTKAMDIARPKAKEELREVVEDNFDITTQDWYADNMDSAYQLIHDDKEL